jgi:N-acetylglutamate synthase-like GNAT family acetyltransferase
MPERKCVRANPHAVPLMLDILESTAEFPDNDILARQLAEEIGSHSASSLSFGEVDFFLGFEDHFPFGLVGLKTLDDCGRLYGPFLYRDYLGRGLGSYLFAEILAVARDQELRLLFALAPIKSDQARNFYLRSGFDQISSDPEFIGRWREGILADLQIASATALFARLVAEDI